MNREIENRPGWGNRAASTEQINTPSITAGADNLPDPLAHVAGAYVALVETTSGRFRRRVYFNLPSAQRAVDRAQNAGHTATIILCQLTPIAGEHA